MAPLRFASSKNSVKFSWLARQPTSMWAYSLSYRWTNKGMWPSTNSNPFIYFRSIGLPPLHRATGQSLAFLNFIMYSFSIIWFGENIYSFPCKMRAVEDLGGQGRQVARRAVEISGGRGSGGGKEDGLPVRWCCSHWQGWWLNLHGQDGWMQGIKMKNMKSITLRSSWSLAANTCQLRSVLIYVLWRVSWH